MGQIDRHSCLADASFLTGYRYTDHNKNAYAHIIASERQCESLFFRITARPSSEGQKRAHPNRRNVNPMRADRDTMDSMWTVEKDSRIMASHPTVVHVSPGAWFFKCDLNSSDYTNQLIQYKHDSFQKKYEIRNRTMRGSEG